MDKLFAQATKRNTPKILALAKNYFPKGATDAPKTPQVFSKVSSSLLYKGEQLVIETKSQVNYEVELGVMIGKGGKHITKQRALDHVGGYFLALDMTDWSMLSVCRETGFPWDISKGQDGFLPISGLIPKEEIADPQQVGLRFLINQTETVNGSTADMYFQVDQIIEYISRYMTLNEGDLILTGTPKLAPVENGDKLSAFLSYKNKQLASINVDVIRKSLEN